MEEKIIIKGARENNLKNISLTIPRNKLVVFTGVSGSGKSTLAFDTIFAEGQRRYIESLSSYARMFLGQSQKPDVDTIEGLSPSISIDQKTTNHNPRSTVGTITEIYDYFRLLFARVGTPYCPHCNRPIEKQSIDQIVDKIMAYEEGQKVLIIAPVVRSQKGAQQKLFENLRKSGYSRVIVDGNQYTLDEEIVLDKNLRHDISVIIDRLVIKSGINSRLTESLETALKLADGLVIAERVVEEGENLKELFNIHFTCAECGYTLEEITPRLFSFNNPHGACEECTGLGYTLDIDESLVLKNSHLSINQGALNITGWDIDTGAIAAIYLKKLAILYDIDMDKPLKDLPREQLDILLYGSKGEKIEIDLKNGMFEGKINRTFEGLINNLKRRYKETTSEYVKFEIGKLMRQQTCKICKGKRLNSKALSVKIDGKDIDDMCSMSAEELLNYVNNLNFENKEHREISEGILREIKNRLGFLVDVGLNYLTLSRGAETLSGGEAQRIRLATQIGSGLVGVLYILDEPSIGLHQRDNERLLKTLEKLRDLGNTLIVVEHDEDTIRRADHIVDFGPYAGVHGGEIVAEGPLSAILKNKKSITAKYLRGDEKIEIPEKRREYKNGFLKVKGAKLHNLKNIDVDIPLGVLTCITGVSGSGKSSLVNGVLYPYLATKLNRANAELPEVENIENINLLDKVILIDQAPIGRTPRSNPATYTNLFTSIRELFALTPDAKERGYASGRFSFNVRGGRCEACEGAGYKEVEMYFLPDITVPCEVCKGKRYNRETLEVKYKGKSIADVLDMTVEYALDFFKNHPKIASKLQALYDVGLGYIKLGQSATTLSGGEAQRVKLATELAKKSTGRTIYVMDEPTTGLHMYDVHKLTKILDRLVDAGNTVVVIEHNLDVIKCADHIIDLGPEGGDKGGEVVAVGTPEEVAKCGRSYTGKFLSNMI